MQPEEITEENMEQKFREAVIADYRDGFGMKDWEQKVEKRMNRDILENTVKLEKLERCKPSLKIKTVLSVGSGYGGFAIAAAQHGATSYGVDPNPICVRIATLRAKQYALPCTFECKGGEELPYPDNFFDLTDTHSVLEHVQDPVKVIREMIRVTKPGGMCHIHAPNYYYPGEPHYQVIWLPKMPKVLGRVYLRAMGKNTEVLDSLNWITPFTVLNAVKGIDSITVQRIGKAKHLNISESKTLASVIKRLGWNAMTNVYEALGIGGGGSDPLYNHKNGYKIEEIT